ncbi:MAG: cytochrome o ubiquinol oxidase subunit IV [Syntrophobacteraceae bacterium]|jgi:cytochrome o ubiquinol oxidase subunit IV
MNGSQVNGAGASIGGFKTYATGFILSVVLTAAAFAVAAYEALPRPVALSGLFGAAVLQILVHLRCFLHLNGSSASRWNVLALLFTVLILILFVGGTIWIMNSLNARMM